VCWGPVTKEGRSDWMRIAKKQFRTGIKCIRCTSNDPVEEESKNWGG
jgi:hypothetical protein